MTPQDAFEALLAGNDRHTSGVSKYRDLSAEIATSASGQFPLGVVLSCLDSRTAPEQMFDQGVGDIFVGRIAGNFADEEMIGSFEFAHKLAGAKVLAVVGHSSCGAVKGACDHVELGNLTHLLKKIDPAVEAVKGFEEKDRNSKNADFVQKVVLQNVRQTVADIRSRSEVLAAMENAGEIKIVGAMYSLTDGKVTLLD